MHPRQLRPPLVVALSPVPEDNIASANTSNAITPASSRQTRLDLQIPALGSNMGSSELPGQADTP